MLGEAEGWGDRRGSPGKQVGMRGPSRVHLSPILKIRDRQDATQMQSGLRKGLVYWWQANGDQATTEREKNHNPPGVFS